MPRQLRPATADQRARVTAVLIRLRAAREDAKAAGCPQLLDAIRHALKSADGARRHVQRRRNATLEARP